MDASCGPSNAVTKLAQHSQRDNSLQNEFITRNQQGSGPQSFRQQNQVVDARLNSDFQKFHSGADFANSFMSNRPAGYTQAPARHQNQQSQGPANAGWVQDFSGLSIQGKPQAQHTQAPRSDWHQQFMQQTGSSQQHQQHQQHQQGMDMGAQFIGGPTAGFSMNMRTNLSTPLYGMNQQGEHREAHQFEQQYNFDEQFDLLEQELANQQESQVQQENVVDEMHIDDSSAKDQFAKTAQEVEKSLRSSISTNVAMNDKIQNSQFLKLMSSIGNRQVELDGDKLVDKTSGQDVREIPEAQLNANSSGSSNVHSLSPSPGPSQTFAGSDGTHGHLYEPVRPMTQAPNPVLTRVPENRDQTNRLPDPLAHIQDGDLANINEPLLAAKIVSGNQVQSGDWSEDFDSWSMPRRTALPATGASTNNTKFRPGNIMSEEWQQVYDDYRHDDDYN